MTTKALVVIPCLNEARHIEAVLSCLLHRLSANLDLRVVVADGGSSDGTREIVTRLARTDERLQLLNNPERIQSAAVNLAARRWGRDADVLIRCDAHAEYPEGYLAGLVETLERTQADAVVVPLDSKGEAPLQKAIAWISNSPVGTGGSAHRAGHKSGFVDHGHHAAFRMSSFRSAGGYDQTFTHNEDAELDCRQRALGAKIYLDSQLRVGYLPRATLSALYRQYFKYGQGRSRTVRRHPQSLRLRQLAVPGHLAFAGLAVLAAAWTPWLLLWPAAYLTVLCLASCQLAVRHRDACALLGVAAALTMHTAWALGFFNGFLAHRERSWGAHMAVPLRWCNATGDAS